MKMPVTVHLSIKNQDEYNAFERLMTSGSAGADGDKIKSIINGIKYTELFGIPSDLPEARLFVDGRLIKEGSLATISEMFVCETTAHSGPVTLYSRAPDSIEFKVTRRRVIASLTPT